MNNENNFSDFRKELLIMDSNVMSPADIAALTKNGNGDFSQAGMWWVLLIFLIAGGGNWGGHGSVPQNNGVTQAELTNGLNNNAIQSQLNSIQLQNAQNDLNTVQAIGQQTDTLMQQNNTNLINAIQGFNTVNTNLMSQTNQLGSKLDGLGAQVEQCCCRVMTKMLEDRNADLQNIVNSQQAQISNYNQSQYLLGQMGRWVGWSTTGTADATKVLVGA